MPLISVLGWLRQEYLSEFEAIRVHEPAPWTATAVTQRNTERNLISRN